MLKALHRDNGQGSKPKKEIWADIQLNCPAKMFP